MKNAQKSRMLESSSGAPAFELNVGVGSIFGDELDRGVGCGIAGPRGFDGSQEYGRVRRNAEKFAEREAAVRELA